MTLTDGIVIALIFSGALYGAVRGLRPALYLLVTFLASLLAVMLLTGPFERLILDVAKVGSGTYPDAPGVAVLILEDQLVAAYIAALIPTFLGAVLPLCPGAWGCHARQVPHRALQRICLPNIRFPRRIHRRCGRFSLVCRAAGPASLASGRGDVPGKSDHQRYSALGGVPTAGRLRESLMFENLLHQDSIAGRLRHDVAEGMLPPAILLSGPSMAGN
jgi:hypothetical protein